MIKGNALIMLCNVGCRCYLRPENECVSETKYLKYQQNIEGNSRFRIGKCENFLSSLAPLARIFIDCS